MNKLLYIITSVCITANVNAESLLTSLLNKYSNHGVAKRHNVSKVKFGNFYIYRAKQAVYKETSSTSNDKPKATSELGYDPVAIAAALEWQQRDKSSDDVINNIESSEKKLLYGDDSPLRDDAVVAAWNRAHAAEQALKAHREYMKSVSRAKKVVSDVKENDTKTNQSDEGSQ